MDGRVFLIVALALIQFSSAEPITADVAPLNPPSNDTAKGPLTDEDKAEIGNGLQKLREQGELLKKEMRKFSSSFPGLDKMTELLVNSVNHQANSFVNFNKERLEDPKRVNKDTRFRKSFDVLKNLERGIFSELQTKFGALGKRTAPATRRNTQRARGSPLHGSV